MEKSKETKCILSDAIQKMPEKILEYLEKGRGSKKIAWKEASKKAHICEFRMFSKNELKFDSDEMVSATYNDYGKGEIRALRLYNIFNVKPNFIHETKTAVWAFYFMIALLSAQHSFKGRLKKYISDPEKKLSEQLDDFYNVLVSEASNNLLQDSSSFRKLVFSKAEEFAKRIEIKEQSTTSIKNECRNFIEYVTCSTYQHPSRNCVIS